MNKIIVPIKMIGKKNFHTGLEEPDNMKYFDLVK